MHDATCNRITFQRVIFNLHDTFHNQKVFITLRHTSSYKRQQCYHWSQDKVNMAAQ